VNPDQKPPAAPLVAVVDDDASLRRSTKLLVDSLGLRCEAFAGAQAFLDWPLLGEAACLILDLIMPGMNGLALQRQLLRIRPSLPIIVITAGAKEHEERQALSSGAVAVLRKPVPEGLLLSTLCSVLRSGPDNSLCE